MNRATKSKKKEDKFESVRRKLVEMRQDLIRESKAEIGQILNGSDKYNGVSDDGDLAAIAYRESMQVAELTRHRNRLKTIEEALRKIDDGTYGICEDCAEEIPLGRLNAMPFALRCIECQERHEAAGSEYEEATAPSPAGESEEGNED